MSNLSQKTGYHIQSAEEVNEILREVATYTIHGLSQPDADVKQYYLERIYLSLSMSLDDLRRAMPWVEAGKPPCESDSME